MRKRIFIAGHNGMVGSAICRHLNNFDIELITANKNELDLTNQNQVNNFFKTQKPDQIYLAAAKVGGIHANNEYPAEFIYENLMIEANVIHAAHINDIQNLLFLGSSCIYPKLAKQPMEENALLTGKLENTNEPYAIAKIAGIKLCESFNRQFGRDYRSIMPTNLYGPNDNFHAENSHVIPALLRRFHNAKINKDDIVTAWGTGKPLREFLHVDDMAEASVFVMNLNTETYLSNTSSMLSHINVGTGKDCSINDLVRTIASVVGFTGKIEFDSSKPDGSPRKLMDISRLQKLGWKAKISLEEGINNTYKWFLKHEQNIRK